MADLNRLSDDTGESTQHAKAKSLQPGDQVLSGVVRLLPFQQKSTVVVPGRYNKVKKSWITYCPTSGQVMPC